MPKFTSNRFENKLWLLRYAKYVKNSDNKSEGIKSTPFLQYVGSYLNVYLPKLQRHQGTIKTLRSSLSLFIRFIRKIKALPVESFLVQDCSLELVNEWLEYEIKEHKISSATRNRHLSALKSYIKYVLEFDESAVEILIRLSHIRYLKVIEPIRETLTEDQVIKIINNAALGYKGQRDSAMLLLMYETAIRVQELVNLKLQDISLTSKHPFIQVFGKGSKYRRINLSSEMATIMQNYCNASHVKTHPNTPLFYSTRNGNPCALSTRQVEKILFKSAELTRLEDPTVPKRVYPHMLRRSKATLMLRSGTPMSMVSVLLGHSHIDTTTKYATYSQETIKEAIESTTIANKNEEKEWTSNDLDELLRQLSLTP